MTPSAFTFKLSVPNDPKMAVIVGDMARHAADYAKLDEARAVAFSERAQAAGTALNGDSNKTTLVVFAAADGTLKLTIGSQSITQPLPSS